MARNLNRAHWPLRSHNVERVRRVFKPETSETNTGVKLLLTPSATLKLLLDGANFFDNVMIKGCW